MANYAKVFEYVRYSNRNWTHALVLTQNIKCQHCQHFIFMTCHLTGKSHPFDSLIKKHLSHANVFFISTFFVLFQVTLVYCPPHKPHRFYSRKKNKKAQLHLFMVNLYFNETNKPLKVCCLHKEVKNLLCAEH